MPTCVLTVVFYYRVCYLSVIFCRELIWCMFCKAIHSMFVDASVKAQINVPITTHRHRHTHTHTHTHMHIHTRTHTCTHAHAQSLTHYPLAHPAECDVSWGKTGKYLAMGYDRRKKEWTDKGRALCKSQKLWQGVGIGRRECKKICKRDRTCGGIFGSLGEANETSGGVCWMCSFKEENCHIKGDWH